MFLFYIIYKYILFAMSICQIKNNQIKNVIYVFLFLFSIIQNKLCALITNMQILDRFIDDRIALDNVAADDRRRCDIIFLNTFVISRRVEYYAPLTRLLSYVQSREYLKRTAPLIEFKRHQTWYLFYSDVYI